MNKLALSQFPPKFFEWLIFENPFDNFIKNEVFPIYQSHFLSSDKIFKSGPSKTCERQTSKFLDLTNSFLYEKLQTAILNGQCSSQNFIEF